MNHKSKLFLFNGAVALTAVSCAIAMTSIKSNNKPIIKGDAGTYVLNLNRSITSEEVTAGRASFDTQGGSHIYFAFDSTKASVDSGLISLATGGYFYNDTKITGITQLEFTLTSGSAVVSYGNAKDALYIGTAPLSGTSPIQVNLSTPSDYFKISNITGPMAISNIKISYSCSNSYEPDIHEGAEEFLSSSAWADGIANHYFVSPADSKVLDLTTDVIAFDVKFISNSGTLSFYLNQYFYGKYCGIFQLSTAGVLTGAGASLTTLDNNWYRITIDLAATTKGGDPEFVSKFTLSGTTANGYVKYMGIDTHYGAKEFTSESIYKGGNGNYYFVTPADSKVIDPTTDTIAFDVKFTSNSGQLGFYLRKYYYGAYCGPFTLSAAGVLTGAGASLSSLASLGENWYRITINLATTSQAGDLEYVSNCQLTSTTANGFIKYMGLAN